MFIRSHDANKLFNDTLYFTVFSVPVLTKLLYCFLDPALMTPEALETIKETLLQNSTEGEYEKLE